ncbi:hypothetical protein BLNAU_11277 [Blattamonas nauphoetae]|uniref:Uncharacterized protein n=1 Tax=Blattamonas nauphoetae TaxID=2049346 RepID=A0ABQ9XQG5_9EUKA|nr:hypothetical protein BLNAU_11277 [Blattamonas nauphoetae]
MVLGMLILKNAPTSLRYLDLSKNKLGLHPPSKLEPQRDSTSGCKIIARVLVDPRVSLSTLILDHNPLGNFGILCLSQVISHSVLRELSLSDVNGLPHGMMCLFRAINHSLNLTTLNLSHNIIGHEAFTLLLKNLPETQISSLSLRDTYLDNVILIRLGGMMKENCFTTKLDFLDISENAITENEAQDFCNLIRDSVQVGTIACAPIPHDMISPRQNWNRMDTHYTFIKNQVKFNALKGTPQEKKLKPLKKPNVNILTQLQYLKVKSFSIVSVLLLLFNAGLNLYDNINDIIAGAEYIQNGVLVAGIAMFAIVVISLVAGGIWYFVKSQIKRRRARRSGYPQSNMRWMAFLYSVGLGQLVETFILMYRTHGNWEVLKDENPIDMVSKQTFNTIEFIRLFLEQIPSILINGLYLIVLNEQWGTSIILSFVLAIFKTARELGGHISTIHNIPKETPQIEELDDSLFEEIKVDIYILFSFSLVVIRMLMGFSLNWINLLHSLVVGFLYYFVIFLVLFRFDKKNPFDIIAHAGKISFYSMFCYSDVVFCSLRGRAKYYLYCHRVHRVVFLIIDLVAMVYRIVTFCWYLIASDSLFHPLVLAIFFSLPVFDVFFYFVRIVIDMNGVARAKVFDQIVQKTRKNEEAMGISYSDDDDEYYFNKPPEQPQMEEPPLFQPFLQPIPPPSAAVQAPMVQSVTTNTRRRRNPLLEPGGADGDIEDEPLPLPEELEQQIPPSRATQRSRTQPIYPSTVDAFSNPHQNAMGETVRSTRSQLPSSQDRMSTNSRTTLP